ncbi:hypothetical protein HRbin01_01173 [archaeon HR01]|nr:hypothetical protein HRbin01_01173 [archaeon HR01]
MESKEKIEKMVADWLKMVEELMKESGLPIVPDPKTSDPVWVDVRELRLRYLIPVKRIRKFFEGLAEGKLYVTKCPAKNIYYFPPQADCPACMDENIVWDEISGNGKLLTYTVVNVKPYSFAHHSNYVIAIARMSEGFNILSWMSVDDLSKIHVGMDVKLVVKRREPEGFFTYYLEPA